MDDSFTESHGKNGVLRKFNDDTLNDVSRAKVSQDGSFCSALTSQGLVTFSVLSSQPVKLHLPGKIEGFCWARLVQNTFYDLSLPGVKNFLVVLDPECNLCLYSVQSSEETGHSCRVELISYVSKDALIRSHDKKDKILSLELTDAAYDDHLHKFEILLIADSRQLWRVSIQQDEEPIIDVDITLNEFNGMFNGGTCKFISSQIKDSLVLLVDEQLTLYIVSLFLKSLVQKVNLRDLLLTEDYEKVNDNVYHLCSISSDCRHILFYDECEGAIHEIHLRVEDLEIIVHQNEKPREVDYGLIDFFDYNFTASTYGMVIQNEVWRNELNSFHKEIDEGEILAHEDEDRGFLIQRYINVTLPEWTTGFEVKELTLATKTALFVMKSTGDHSISLETDPTESLNSIIMQYNLDTKAFVAQSLPENAVIAESASGFIPTCILSNEHLYVPTFDTTQEQLISSIIQYTGIAEAETICRSNQWSQFSIPLHSLEVGLQHRQTDSISFFLRTRDKAFSRYWKHMSSSVLTSDSTPTTANRDTNTDYIGSPSLKSILLKASMESSFIDPDELRSAVDMLIKAIHQNSKGKHKKNFFETLLRLTVDFLNSLIMDGANVLENLGHEEETIDYEDRETSFRFLIDIPESLDYLVNCIVDVRQYISDIPEFCTVQDETDTVDGGASDEIDANMSLADYMEKEIFAGRIAHLQSYLLEKGELDWSLQSINEFGLDFAYRKLKKQNIQDAVLILRNLGNDERAILKRLFEVTLDRGLRDYLLSEFDKEPYKSLLSEEDLRDVEYLKAVENFYPCNAYNKDNIIDNWEALKPNLHDVNDLIVADPDEDNLMSLQEYDQKDVQMTGLYSELSFNWIKHWNDRSRKFVILDAAFQTNHFENIDKIADSATLWDYLTRHNDVETMIDWIRSSQNKGFSVNDDQIRYPNFNPSLLQNFAHATKQMQKTVYRELLRYGIYTTEMKRDFYKVLKIVSEDCSLFKKSDQIYTLPAIFANQFVNYCLRNNLREILYLYLDTHELYPIQEDMSFEDLDINKYTWFKMMSAFRKFQNYREGILDMSLCTAEHILKVSGEELRMQLCRRRPLTTLATVLTSSLELTKVFNDDAPESEWLDKSLLEESLRKYPTLYSGIFTDNETEEKRVSTIQLLQDNTELDAINFFKWRQSGDMQSSVPNFSSKELVEKFGQHVNLTYTYFLKQKRPVYAYLVFMKDSTKAEDERKNSLQKAFWEAYKLAIENFNQISVTAACIFFVDLLCMDSYSVRVDIESANFILHNYSMENNDEFDSEEKLKMFIVDCLMKKNGRVRLLKMLEECVEAGLTEKGLCWSSYEAILYYRPAVQFAQVSNLAPPARLIVETIKDGCWFHAIVFMQIYQLKPSEILPSLEMAMENTVLREHIYAIIKNAKKMEKMLDQQQESEQSARKKTELKQGVKSSVLGRNFRAQFYFSLKKGPEYSPTEGNELLSPTKSTSVQVTPGTSRKEALGHASSESCESINERTSDKPDERTDSIQRLDNILDIVLECEDTRSPSKMLLKYATSNSQPFLAVLAACYKESVPLDCLSAWIISSTEKNRRPRIFQSISNLKKPDWNAEEMFNLLSDLLQNEEKSIKIIADGFTIFMNKNPLYSFFKFCDAFIAKEDPNQCSNHLHAFTSQLEKLDFTSSENEFVMLFFETRIPIKVLNVIKSNFYQTKLLQMYIDAGLDKFLPQESILFERLKTICELTKETAVAPDYLILASCVQNRVNDEENRIYEQLIIQKHLKKALQMSKSLNLPEWKVTFSEVENDLLEMKTLGLWYNPESRFEFWMKADKALHKCCCSYSVAGSFFEAQGLLSENLPFEERALLLAIAFSWYVIQPENMLTEEDKEKLGELEKHAWLFKMNAEVKRAEMVEREGEEQLMNSKVIEDCSVKMADLLNRRCRVGSGVNYQKGENNLLILDDVFDIDKKYENKENWNDKENQAFEIMIGDLLENGEIAQAKRVCNLFAKTTNDLELVLTSISLAQGIQQIDSLDRSTKILLANTPTQRLSISGSYNHTASINQSVSTHGSATSTGISEWVVVEEVQNAIEKLLSKCRKGRNCCERVLICFSISKILAMSYEDVVSLRPFDVLRYLIFSDMDQQLNLCRQFLKIFSIKDEEVAAFIAKIVLRLIQSKANIALNSLTVQEFTDTTKLNSNEIPRLMQLVHQPTTLGKLLLEEASSLVINQTTDDDASAVLEVHVELLIRAHDCFTLSCNMEGISEVLHAARLCNVQLTRSKSYSLMVRMLTGIGRFKEMSYIFEALNEEHHFELLFRKNIEKEGQLKSALLDFIKRNHPNDTDKIDMLSRRFGMHREVGEQFEETGEKQIQAISKRFSAMSKDMETDLKSIANTYSYAAANYKKVACLRKSTHCYKKARLAELQIRLLPQGKQIIGLEKHSVLKLLCSHQNFYEAFLIADAYNVSSPSSWVEPLFERVIIKGEMSYLRQYLSVFQLTGPVIMEIVSRYRNERSTSGIKEHLKDLLSHLKDVKLRYKIAVEFSFNDIINSILEKPNGAYIKDTLFSL